VCDGGQSGLIEIKCPYTARNMAVDEAFVTLLFLLARTCLFREYCLTSILWAKCLNACLNFTETMLHHTSRKLTMCKWTSAYKVLLFVQTRPIPELLGLYQVCHLDHWKIVFIEWKMLLQSITSFCVWFTWYVLYNFAKTIKANK